MHSSVSKIKYLRCFYTIVKFIVNCSRIMIKFSAGFYASFAYLLSVVPAKTLCIKLVLVREDRDCAGQNRPLHFWHFPEKIYGVDSSVERKQPKGSWRRWRRYAEQTHPIWMMVWALVIQNYNTNMRFQDNEILLCPALTVYKYKST